VRLVTRRPGSKRRLRALPFAAAARPWILGVFLLLAPPKPGRAQEETPAIQPEIQLFINARTELVEGCVYRLTERDVTVGAMKALVAQLEPALAQHFPLTLPAKPGDALTSFAFALRNAAAEPKAKAEGWTLKKLVERSIDAYCRTLDAHSDYTDEETSRQLDFANQPDYVGVGLTIRKTGHGYFAEPFRGRAADLAGIRRGDEILAIDSADVRAMTLLEVSKRLSGAAGSSVRVLVRHADHSEELIPIESVLIASTPISMEQSGNTYIIKFAHINARALEDCRQGLATVGKSHPLVLDFRGCDGGELAASVGVAELFLPKGTPIARFEHTKETENAVSHNPAPFRPKRMILLQDEGTASGAELIIATLLDYPPLHAESRGEKSFGKGVTQAVIRVVRGGYLTFSDARMYGPHDEFWEGEGLPPTSNASVDEFEQK